MSDELVRVRLLGVPVAIHLDTAEHRDALDREFALAEADDAEGLSVRLRELTELLRGRLQGMRDLFDRELNAALEEGRDRFDIDVDVPPEVVDGIDEISGLLDAADAAARDGELLTIPASPASVAYRRWLLGEMSEQIRTGRPARPWPGTGDPEPEPTDRGLVSNDGVARTIQVTDDLDFTTAATLRTELTCLIDTGVGEVVIDLSGCDFVDSVGVGLLVATHQRCEAEGGQLRLRGVTPNVERAFDLAGLLEVLHVG